MMQSPRILTPASRRWTFAVVCGLCAAVYNVVNTEGGALEWRVRYLVVTPLLASMLVGFAARSSRLAITSSLTSFRHPDRPMALGTATALLGALAEWATFAFAMAMLYFFFGRPLLDVGCSTSRGLAIEFAVFGACLWPAAAAITAVVERVPHRASSRRRVDTVGHCPKSAE